MVESAEVSPREAEVLTAVGEHLSNTQIAHRLHISVRTVESHVSSLLRKLGVADRRELAGLAGGMAHPTAGRFTGIPVSRTTFVGRSRDLDVALERLAQTRLVTLLGPGGVGKTRLAAVVAESVASSYPAGGAFVDLVPVRAGYLIPAVAGALGVAERPARSLEDAIVDRLGAGRSLIMLDNCEHLVEEVGSFVERVLSECPQVTILATSRERLGLTGEHVAPVHGLPLDSDAAITLSQTAVEAARRASDPALIAAAMDVLGWATVHAGHFREACRIIDERMRIVETLAAHEPSGAAEITDAYHMAASTTVASGDLPAAHAVVQRARLHDPVGDHPYLWAPKLVRVLALSGRFDEASDAACLLWDNWVHDGSPAMAWMASALAAAALVHGLRGDGRYELWRARALTVAGCDDPIGSPDLMAIMAFVEARIATHTGHVDRVGTLVERADAAFPERWWEGYARAAGAELAVVAGLPDAAARLARIKPLAAEHRWAAACLTRARGRLERDPDAIAEALTHWEGLGARFERACTLLLLPGREPEGQAELRAIGCPPPAGHGHPTARG